MSGQVDERRRMLAEGSGRQADGWGVGRVEAALLRAAGDAAMKRARFRDRWIETGAPTSAPDEAEMAVKVGVLFERVGEIVQDLEDGLTGEVAEAALRGALDALDGLDDRLGDIERWVRAVAARRGVTLAAPGEGARS